MLETKLLPLIYLRLVTPIVLLSVTMISSGNELFAQGRHEVILQSGDVSPDGNGVFSDFYGFQFNNSGQIMFNGQMTATAGGSTDEIGIYRYGSGSITQIVRQGQTVPGSNDVFGYSTRGQVLKDSGEVVFFSTLQSSSGGYEGFFKGNGSAVSKIVSDGDSADNGNGAFSKIFLLSSGGNRSTIRGRLTGTTGGNSDNEGIFHVNRFGQAKEALRIGESVAGFGTITGFETHAYSANSIGQSAITVDRSGGRGDAIVRNQGVGQNVVIVKQGDLAPDGIGTFDGFVGRKPLINAKGQVAFSGSVSASNSTKHGIYFGTGGLLTEVVQTGRQSPGNQGSFESIDSRFLANDVGDFFFQGHIENVNGTRSGIFRGDGSSIVELVKEGQMVHDGNGQFNSIISFSGRANNNGQIAHVADIRDTIGGTTDNSGLFTSDGTDSFLIARKGELLGGSTISNLFLGDVNHMGQISYRLGMADGSVKLRVWTPELHWRGDYGGSWDGDGQWTLGVTPGAVHDVFVDPDARLTVYGSTSDQVVRSLSLGGKSGVATLELVNGRVLTAIDGVNIQTKGVLTGDGTVVGDVFNNFGGALIADNLTIAGNVSNFGIIRGTGIIESSIYNGVSGQIRANGNDQLSLIGPSLFNEGRIEVIGGELQVSGEFVNATNTGMIAGRNATMRFDNGLINDGAVGISFGTSDIFGDIVNSGIVNVSGGANTTFYDDIDQFGIMQIAKVGSVESNAVVFGAFSGPGGFVGGGNLFALGDLRPGASPSSVLFDGNLYMGTGTRSFIELGGTGLGDFDQLMVTGDLGLAGELRVSLIDGHSLRYNQLYMIAEVDGLLTGTFSGLSEGGLVGNFGGYDLFISYTLGDGNDIGLFTSVPEPLTSGLLLPVMAVLLCRRNRPKVQNND